MKYSITIRRFNYEKKTILGLMVLLMSSTLFAQSVKSKKISTFDGDAVEYSVKLGGEAFNTGFIIGKLVTNNESTFWIEFYQDHLGGNVVASSVTKTANLLALEYSAGGIRHKIVLGPDDIKIGRSAQMLLDANSYREYFRVSITEEQFLEILNGSTFAYKLDTRTGGKSD